MLKRLKTKLANIYRTKDNASKGAETQKLSNNSKSSQHNVELKGMVVISLRTYGCILF